jgi:hypothetical protein
MKIGISIPESLHSPDQLFEWVRRVDQGPFSTPSDGGNVKTLSSLLIQINNA